MGYMTKITKSKILTAITFFILGYMSNNLFDRVRSPGPVNVEGVERYPVNPDDFDTRKMIEAIKESKTGEWEQPIESGASIIGEITQREDDKFVYYEIPINQSANTNHELKVEIKDGFIHIAEVSKSTGKMVIETNAERMFSLDPSLDSALAEVLDQKNIVLIKIPKRRI
jgi:hypothetical protein